MQKDEERNLQSRFTKANMTQSSNLKNALSLFPRLNGLNRKFLSEIHMITLIQPDTKDISKDIFIIVKNDGYVYSFGSEIDKSSCTKNSSSTSEFKNWLTPIKPKLIENFCGKSIKTFIHSFSGAVFVLTNEGEVYSWGHKNHCFLGYDVYPTDTPILVTNLNNENIVDIVCHKDHGLALTVDGRVYKWGRNLEIQHDMYDEYEDDIDYLNPPTQVEFEVDTKIVCIACSSFCNMMVTNNGEVYSRGTLFHDRLHYFNPMCKITFSHSTDVIVKVVCGLNHTLALTNQGDLYVWGCNQYGQLGNGNRTDVRDPLLLNTSKMGKLSDIAALNTHDMSVAVNKNGCFYVWGRYTKFDFLIPHATFHTSMYDVFASERVMYKPLILSADDKYMNQKSNIIRCLKDAFDDPSTSDFKIQVEGRDIHLHKVVLKICSSYFRTMFQHEWVENTKNELKLDMFSYNVYKAYLKYLYTGMIDIPSEELLELLKLADMYGDMNLKTDCIPIIQKVITISNVALFYSKAMEYNEKRIKEFCFSFALKNMTEMIQTESFMKLDEETKNMFLVKAAKAGIFKT